MNYFNNVKTEKELKAKYKELALKYHPDVYGDKGNEIMKDIHQQLEKAVKDIHSGFIKEFIEDDVIESEEILQKKRKCVDIAKNDLFPEGALFALYWTEGLRPRNHRNPLTLHNFSGWNIWTLEIEMILKNYKSAEWSTFAQYRQNNNNIRKGEHGTYLTLAIIKKTTDDKDEKEKTSVYYKSYSVFNVEQTQTGSNDEVVKIEDKKNKWSKYEVIA